jgi:hypothetical protein
LRELFNFTNFTEISTQKGKQKNFHLNPCDFKFIMPLNGQTMVYILAAKGGIIH